MARALFVTGTGTDIGKTYVSGLLLKKLVKLGTNPGYFKAAMSGNERSPDGTLIPGDAQFVRQMAGLAQPLETMCPFVYENPWSPHLAAQVEGHPVTLDKIVHGFQAVCAEHDFVVVEGSGGVVCPLRRGAQPLGLEDVIRELGLASLIITPSGLGAINSAALTAFYMTAQGLPVQGLLFNRFHPGDFLEEDNARVCQEMTGLPVVAMVQDGATDIEITPTALCDLFISLTQR